MKKILIALFCVLFSAQATAGGGLDGFLNKLNAKDLGIKPGSAEFHALKRGDFHLGDASSDDRGGKGRGKGKTA